MIEARSPDAERYARDLRAAGDDLEHNIHDAEREVANLTADRARSRAASLGGLPAHVAPALSAHDNSVELASGGSWAMAPGAEYGRDRYHVHPYHGSNGYFLTPTIHDTDKERQEAFERAADQAFRKVD